MENLTEKLQPHADFGYPGQAMVKTFNDPPPIPWHKRHYHEFMLLAMLLELLLLGYIAWKA